MNNGLAWKARKTEYQEGRSLSLERTVVWQPVGWMTEGDQEGMAEHSVRPQHIPTPRCLN